MKFIMKDIKGNIVKSSDYSDKKIYMKFWATWCPVCLNGLREFNALAQEEHDFVVLSVVAPSVRNEMNEAQFSQWFSGLDTNKFNVLYDEGGTFADEINIKSAPTSIFLNREHQLVNRQVGHIANQKVIEIMNNI